MMTHSHSLTHVLHSFKHSRTYSLTLTPTAPAFAQSSASVASPIVAGQRVTRASAAKSADGELVWFWIGWLVGFVCGEWFWLW